MIKIEEVKKNFLEWCKGFLSTHVDYKVDMSFDLDFIAEGIWNKIEQDYEQLLFLEDKQSRSVEIPEPFIVQDEVLDKNVMVTVAGKPYYCKCGCNIFTKLINSKGDLIYRCHGCGREYEGE